MSNEDTIRAWTDPEYRAQLSEAEKAQLPENPAGPVEIEEHDLDNASGGAEAFPTFDGCSPLFSCDPCSGTLNGGTCMMGTWGCCESAY